MLRNILSLIAGLAAGVIAVFAIHSLNYLLFPPAEGLDYNKPEDLALMMGQLPPLAFAMLELSYLVGSFLTGAVIGRFAARRPLPWAISAGGLLTAANLVNLTNVPTPLWLAVLTTVTFLPATWLGARLTARR